MGKRKDDSGEGSSHKKHKKNKHKKAKARGDESRVAEAQPGVRPLTLKIKLGGKPITKTAVKSEEELSGVEDVADSSPYGAEESWPPSDNSFTENTADQEGGVGSDGDEEAWLVAMEKGQLDETGYLPRRLGSTLTARQRAMMGSADGQLLELPLSSKGSKEMTEEMILKKTEKNRKRRLAAQRRKERRKAETVRKLLEKQSKKKQEDKPAVEERTVPAYLHYVSSQHGASLSLPRGVDFPMPSQQTGDSRPVQLCTVEGCPNPRRYSDSATQLPLCSLQCYKILHRHLTLHTPLAVSSTQSISS